MVTCCVVKTVSTCLIAVLSIFSFTACLVTGISKVSTSTSVQTKARSFVAAVVLTELAALFFTKSTVQTSYTVVTKWMSVAMNTSISIALSRLQLTNSFIVTVAAFC